MPRTDAVDISHWQGSVDFPALAAAGVVGVFHKATEGTSYIDPTYAPRMQLAQDAGLCWGAYHFLKHGSISQQMDWFLQQSLLPTGSRVAIDYEDTDCTLDDLQQALEYLGSQAPDLQVCVYAGGLLKGQVGSDPYPWLSPYALWLAQYTTGTPTWPTQIWKHWSLWQYTDKGTISGVQGSCDLNTFNGSPDNCALWFGPPEEPTPAHENVVIDIITPEGVQVVVSVNGETLVGPND